jgi:hypothetical protein
LLAGARCGARRFGRAGAEAAQPLAERGVALRLAQQRYVVGRQLLAHRLGGKTVQHGDRHAAQAVQANLRFWSRVMHEQRVERAVLQRRRGLLHGGVDAADIHRAAERQAHAGALQAPGQGRADNGQPPRLLGRRRCLRARPGHRARMRVGHGLQLRPVERRQVADAMAEFGELFEQAQAPHLGC